MLARLKALPLPAKVIIASLLALFVYGGIQQNRRGRGTQDPSADGTVSDDVDVARLLRQYEEQYAAVTADLKDCAEQMQRTTDQMQAAALSGQMPMVAQPPCAQLYPQWIAQAGFLEAQISRLRTGDTRSLREITGLQAGSTVPGRPGASSGGSDGTGAVERWDRGALRGTSVYLDENGDSHELPTANYYYHDLQSGRFVPSQSPTPPNDGRDYSPMTPGE